MRKLLTYAAVGIAALAGAMLIGTTSTWSADKGGVVTRAEAEQMFPTQPWTAIYGAVGAGVGTLTSDAVPFGVEGTKFSARIGADVQISRILFGVLTDYSWDRVSGFGSSVSPKEWLLAVRGGVLVTNDALIYGLVGSNRLSISGMDTRGVLFGGGAEIAITKNWRLSLEYNQVSYDDLPTFTERTTTARLIFAFPVAPASWR